MGHYSNLKSAIKTKLEGINKIKNVYGYNKGELAGYPSAVIMGFECDSRPVDTANNLREWAFTVRIFQEMDEDALGASGAEDVMDDIVDDIISAFDNDPTLGGDADMMVVGGGSGFEDREAKMRTQDIVITAKKIYQRS